MYKTEKKELIETIQDHIVTVVFTKVNGEQRTMRCSLQPSHLPEVASWDYIVNGHTPVKDLAEQDALAVWDIDVGDWRSFRFDSIISAEHIKHGKRFVFEPTEKDS